MIAILSPAKALDFDKAEIKSNSSQALFQQESEKIMKQLKKLSADKVRDLMKISPKLADLNYARFQNWNLPFTKENSRAAILAFNGEVYNGLRAREFSEDELEFAQNHIRILSGLHGILRPLDLIQEYRLEMGTKLSLGKNKNLYEFWGNKIKMHLEEALSKQKENCLVNLASAEYSKATQLKTLNTRIITPVFKDLKGDEYKVIFVYAKKARGMMARFIVENRIEDPNQLKLFDSEGYFYNENLSQGDNWVFTR